MKLNFLFLLTDIVKERAEAWRIGEIYELERAIAASLEDCNSSAESGGVEGNSWNQDSEMSFDGGERRAIQIVPAENLVAPELEGLKLFLFLSSTDTFEDNMHIGERGRDNI